MPNVSETRVGVDSNVVLLARQEKFIDLINIFWQNCLPMSSGEENCNEQRLQLNPEFRSTLSRRLNQSRASVMLESNLIVIIASPQGHKRYSVLLSQCR